MSKETVLTIDSGTLSYRGKVIPLRSIAYFEKYRIKKPYMRLSLGILIPTLVLAFIVGANASSRDGPVFLLPLGFGGLLWIVALAILKFKKSRFALVLQTTAGDSPRLFETNDEPFLDDLIRQLSLRVSGGDHPSLTVNLKGHTITMGDTYKNISGSTIINRSLVDQSFNSVKRDFDPQTAEAIRKLADFVNASGNRAAAELLDDFNTELVKKAPRKSLLRGIWEGIKNELPTVKDALDIAKGIAAIVA